MALQALYEIDSVGHDVETVLQQRAEALALPEPTVAFARSLVLGTFNCQSRLDRIIEEIAPEWPVYQMAVVDRNILRIAIFEMVVDRETPVKVIINEAVELAKQFAGDSSRRLVNGALGTLASQTRLWDLATVPADTGDTSSPGVRLKAKD